MTQLFQWHCACQWSARYASPLLFREDSNHNDESAHESYVQVGGDTMSGALKEAVEPRMQVGDSVASKSAIRSSALTSGLFFTCSLVMIAKQQHGAHNL